MQLTLCFEIFERSQPCPCYLLHLAPPPLADHLLWELDNSDTGYFDRIRSLYFRLFKAPASHRSEGVGLGPESSLRPSDSVRAADFVRAYLAYPYIAELTYP